MSNPASIPELDRKGLRDFCFLFGAIIAVLFGLLLPWLFDRAYPLWPWAVGAAFALWGIVAPLSVRPFYRLWMRFGLLLSKITTPIIMAATFYLVIFPVALLRRPFGGASFPKRADSTKTTYRVASKNAGPQDLERPF
jgi:hypothetical protein